MKEYISTRIKIIFVSDFRYRQTENRERMSGRKVLKESYNIKENYRTQREKYKDK